MHALGACLLAGIALAAGSAGVGKWQAGTNYTPVDKTIAVSAPEGKVAVAEVFWYGCGHCFALDPALEGWDSTKPDFIAFSRVPVVWGPVHQQHARLYYTLQALGRHDLHAKVFDAIHRGGNLLAARTDEAARAVHLAFFKDHGVPEDDFAAAYDSDAVGDRVKAARELTDTLPVASVPLLMVNGKYTTSVGQAGGERELLQLLGDLAAHEKER
jgi:thiol:disulfide interchange protein DsbA